STYSGPSKTRCELRFDRFTPFKSCPSRDSTLRLSASMSAVHYCGLLRLPNQIGYILEASFIPGDRCVVYWSKRQRSTGNVLVSRQCSSRAAMLQSGTPPVPLAPVKQHKVRGETVDRPWLGYSQHEISPFFR